MIKAILADLDGVLVDACEWHYQALNHALQQISKTIITRDEHQNLFNALSTRKKLERLCFERRVKSEDIEEIWKLKQDITKQYILKNAKLDQEKIDFFKLCKKNNLKFACVTNSILETANLSLKSSGLLPYLDYLVTNEMVTHQKPHPECYIRSFIHLQTMPDECIIIEDSEKGLKSALATGAYVLQVKDATETVSKAKVFLSQLGVVLI